MQETSTHVSRLCDQVLWSTLNRLQMIKQGTLSILAHVLIVLRVSPHICKHDNHNCSHSLKEGTDKVVGNFGTQKISIVSPKEKKLYVLKTGERYSCLCQSMSVETFKPSSPTAAAREMWPRRLRLCRNDMSLGPSYSKISVMNYSSVHVHYTGRLTCLVR